MFGKKIFTTKRGALLLLGLLTVQLLFLHQGGVRAITEDENEVSLRDANSSRERPRLDGFDMDDDV